MPFLASAAINDARDLHPAFDPVLNPDGVVLRALNRYVRALVSKLLEVNVDVISEEVEFALPFADFEAGVQVPAHQFILADRLTDVAGEKHQWFLVPWEQRDQPLLSPAGSIVAGFLRLVGREEYWTPRFTAISVRYVPMTVDVGLSDNVELPESAKEPVVAFLGDFMAGRTPQEANPPVDAGRFRANLDRCEATFLREMGGLKRAVVTGTTVVW